MKKIKTKNIKVLDIVIFLICLIIMGGALLAFYPGLLTSDSVSQLQQGTQNIYSDAHPVLHSFIVSSLYRINNSTATVCFFQIIMFSLIWTKACKVLRKYSTKKSYKIFQLVFTTIIAILPINFIHSIIIWKDIIFSYSILGLLIYIYVGLKENYNYSYYDMIIFSILAVLVMKVRHNGLVISPIIFIIILFMGFIKNREIKKIIIFIAIFVATFITACIPEKVLKVQKVAFSSDLFSSSRLFCMGAILNTDVKIEESDYELLSNIIPIEDWKQAYNKYHALNIFYNEKYNSGYLSEHEDEFKKVFRKYAKQNPKVILQHIVELNSITWSIKQRGYMNSIFTSNIVIHEFSNGAYETTPKSAFLNELYTKMVDTTLNNNTLYCLIYRPALPMYVAVIIILYLMIKNKRFDYIFLLFPMFLNIGVYIFMLPSQDLRYYYPSFITMYFLILVLLEERKVKTLIEQKTKLVKKGDGKTLTIIPAYNESENIQKVLDELKQAFPETDILVINDCSKDNTKEIVEENNINCITTTFNLNYAYAVQTGIKYAKKYNYDYCLMFDGDGQHVAKEAKKLLEKIKETNADIVIGSRYLEKGNYKAPKLRKIGTSFFTWLIKISCHTKITDPLSGFQIINKQVIDKYAKMGEYPEFPDANLIIEMLLDGYTIEEVSIKMRNREFGESMHGGIIKPIKYMIIMLYTILILILNKLFGRRK